MPLSSDPNDTLKIVLACDKNKPDETRPFFKARFMTRRETSQVKRLLAESADDKDYDRGHASLDVALAVGIVGWENMVDRNGNPVDFKVDDVAGRKALSLTDEFLTGREKWELAERLLTETRLTETDRGNSESPAPSGQA
jgi:hypothetical protein